MVVTFLEFPLWSLDMSVFYIPEEAHQRKISSVLIYATLSWVAFKGKKKLLFDGKHKRHNNEGMLLEHLSLLN